MKTADRALTGAGETGLTRQTVLHSLKHLQKLGIVRELTGKERHRLFVYDKFVNILSEGTEPIRNERNIRLKQ